MANRNPRIFRIPSHCSQRSKILQNEKQRPARKIEITSKSSLPGSVPEEAVAAVSRLRREEAAEEAAACGPFPATRPAPPKSSSPSARHFSETALSPQPSCWQTSEMIRCIPGAALRTDPEKQ